MFAATPATSTPLPPALDVRSEVRRLRSDIAFFDQEAARLEGLVANTGSPIHRITLVATRVARSATSQALNAWLHGYH